ncbi:hypothetical protein C8R34_12443 [Nitrosomonas sp. Nm84]|nr:hypothetical protein C8R34_12443 [Nitrosomonas sp. Nm84]
MKKCLSMFLLLIAATAAQAEWVAVDAAAKPGETHYFDPQTLQKNAQFRRIWILSSYDNKQKGGYHAAKSLYEFDCAHEKARSITLLLYPDKKASGAVIGAHHEESQDWFGFSLHSIFRHISEIVCVE